MLLPWRGIFVIAATPYTESYELDEASLRHVVRFCLEAGAHGLVGPAFASEFTVLSDEERRRFIEIVVHEVSGQVPVIAATHSVHTVPAIAASRHAQSVGADGIMNLPPYVVHLAPDACYEHYSALSAAVDIPIIVQNMIGPIGTPMGHDLLARMCRELDSVLYVKEETLPEPRRIARTIAVAGDSCLGVFGGRGGSFLLDEHARGACGNMPGAPVPDVLVDLWHLLETGEHDNARSLFYQLLPLLTFQSHFGAVVPKEILYRRGIIRTPLTRLPVSPLDDDDRRELDTILQTVEPFFRV